jgi:flagellar assembly factor FliW
VIATPVNIGVGIGDDGGAEFETYETSRFGEIQVLVDSIVEFPDGLIGLGGSRYALLLTDPDSPFVWLQSLTDPRIALPVTNPHRFFADFAVELSDEDAEHLGLSHGEPADVFVTVTARDVVAEITVNTKAPILIRSRVGHQVLNQAPGVAVKTPLFPAEAIQSR